MNIRSPSKEDFKQVLEIYRTNGSTYQFNPFKSNTILDDAVVLSKDKVIAYGMIKIFAEAILVMNHDALKIEKGKALIDLMKLAIDQTDSRGIKELYTFTNDKTFENQMIEQFDFQNITSIPLVREIG